MCVYTDNIYILNGYYIIYNIISVTVYMTTIENYCIMRRQKKNYSDLE